MNGGGMLENLKPRTDWVADDELPDGFDPTEFPILATHWFGLAPIDAAATLRLVPADDRSTTRE